MGKEFKYFRLLILSACKEQKVIAASYIDMQSLNYFLQAL
jgi:hypothetical protein